MYSENVNPFFFFFSPPDPKMLMNKGLKMNLLLELLILQLQSENSKYGRVLLNVRQSVSENILCMLCKTVPRIDKSLKS